MSRVRRVVLFAVASLAGIAALSALAGSRRTAARPAATGFLFDTFAHGGTSLRYAIYIPREYDAGKPWPLILFLHGKGESGTDGTKMIVQGLGSAILWSSARWPALVLFPQKPDEEAQWEEHEAALLELIARTRRSYNVDARRIYLTGLSQGGHGVWVLGARHPELWAALAPVCGYGDPAAIAPPLAKMPVWAFHGGADDVVPPEQTKAIVDALKAAGNTPRATIFPGVNHNSWDPAYRDSGLAEWLLGQSRP